VLLLPWCPQAEVPCSYIYLSGLSYILGEVTKVVLGAAAVLSNGTVVSRAGCAAVAMMASANSVPVLVCCETFKFHERVQLDSITHNELGDPEALVQVPPHVRQAAAGGGLRGWEAVGVFWIGHDSAGAMQDTNPQVVCIAQPALHHPTSGLPVLSGPLLLLLGLSRPTQCCSTPTVTRSWCHPVPSRHRMMLLLPWCCCRWWATVWQFVRVAVTAPPGAAQPEV
jgi:hypothetical protein